MKAPAPRRRGDRGAASAQLVLAAPVVLLVLLLAVQVALAWHAKHIAQTAASRGLAEARAHDGTQTAGEDAAAWLLEATAGNVLRTPVVEVTRTDHQAAVEVRGHVLPVIPGLTFTVHGHAAGPIERFVTAQEN